MPRKVAGDEEIIFSVRKYDYSVAGLVRDVIQVKHWFGDGEIHAEVGPSAGYHGCVEGVQTFLHFTQCLDDAGVEEDISVAVAVESRRVRVHGVLVHVLQVGRVEFGHIASADHMPAELLGELDQRAVVVRTVQHRLDDWTQQSPVT